MDTTRIRPQRIRLLGEPVDLTTPAEVMSFTARKVAAGERAIVANHNAHSLYLITRTPQMRDFYNRADLIELDSVPMILWGRLTGKPVSRRHRCTYLDWRDDFWRLAARHGWRVFYLGGAPGVAQTAADRLRARYPGLTLTVRDGYFDDAAGSADNERVVSEINAFQPQVLLVGMGMPRQELWIARHYDRLHPSVVFPLGAGLDYEAGAQTAAPRWLSILGLEWAFRLITSPRRLARRYLIEPWYLLPAAGRDLALAFGPKPRTADMQPLAERRRGAL